MGLSKEGRETAFQEHLEGYFWEGFPKVGAFLSLVKSEVVDIEEALKLSGLFSSDDPANYAGV